MEEEFENRAGTPVSVQDIDPALLQNMLIALTNLQLNNANNTQRSREPKVPDVPTFNGNMNMYNIFLAKLENFFSLQPATYDSDPKRIGYVISRLDGTAADWATTIIENPHIGDNALIRTDWGHFMNAFSRFQDVFSKKNATDKLLRLTQGKNQSVNSYWQKFCEYLYRSEIQEGSAKPLFEKGLRLDIKLKLVDKDLPETLNEFAAKVMELDNKLQRLKYEQGFIKNQNGQFNQVGVPAPYSPATPTPQTSGPTPMEIGKVEQVQDPNSVERLRELYRMDKAEARRICFTEGRCHYCKRTVGNPPAHVAATCPELLKKTKSDYLVVPTEVLRPPNAVKTLLTVPATILDLSTPLIVDVLLDSGAMGHGYIDEAFARQNGIILKDIADFISLQTVDGMPCGNGIVTHVAPIKLRIHEHEEELDLLVIKSPRSPIILGIDWFRDHNPRLDWSCDSITFDSCVTEAGTTYHGVPQRQVCSIKHVLDEDVLQQLKAQYPNVFSVKEFPDLPPNRPGVDLDIELLHDKNPPFGPIYSLAKDEEIALRDYLDGALKAGIIRESKSPAGSPVLFVRKGDKSLRLCVDYRKLNSMTKTNKAALPIIVDLLQRAAGHKYYSKIDLKSAFNLIRIKEGKEYLTAFRTKYGHFEYLVMPFGLKNAPGCFQAFVNAIFGDLIDRGLVAYIDDLLIYSNDRETHDKILLEVFNRIDTYQLKVNPKKIEILKAEVKFLGHILSAEGIRMDPEKLSAIEDWEFPSTVKAMQSFLGLCNYYRMFIARFGEIAAPLFDLTKKDKSWKVTEKETQAFLKLKDCFKKEVILVEPDREAPFYLETDASDFALGGALHQKDPITGCLRPVAFFSRKLSPAELNYDIFDKELLAVIDALKEWRYLLIGSEVPVAIFTDHKNLQHFSEVRQLNRRQARWSLFLADFNFTLHHRKGSKQVVSDALSRKTCHELNDEDKEFNKQTLLDKSLFINSLVTEFRNSDSELEGSNSDFDINEESTEEEANSSVETEEESVFGDLDQLVEIEGNSESRDPIWFQYLLQFLWKGDLPMVLAPSVLRRIRNHAKRYIFKDDRLYRILQRNNHIYHVPYIPYVDRFPIIKKYHTVLGHMQLNTLLPLLEVRYFWPTLELDIKDFQSACAQCQLNGSSSDLSNRPLHPHEPVGLPFIKWGIDFVQDLPKDPDGYCNIFSARCYATKRVIYVATKDRTAKTAAQCIFEAIVCKFGSPLEIVSDRGFMDSVLAEYLKLLEIHHLPSAAYTPRTNGLDERGHQDLKNIITKVSNGDPTKWVKILPLAEFIMNARISNSTGFSPFYLSHGVEPRLPGDEIPAVPPGHYDLNDEGDVAQLSSNELAKLGQNRAAALQRLKVQALRMKKYYDEKVGASIPSWQIGDVVKMINHTRTRFKFRFIGPFYIVDKGPNNTYFLQRPDGRRWTAPNGQDIPVNSDDLARFTEFDGEYYYSGN
jgi:hypothetical protein